MYRVVFLLVGLLLLIPLLYVIFVTPFIPYVLRKLNILRSTPNLKNQDRANEMRGIPGNGTSKASAPSKAADESAKTEPQVEVDDNPEVIFPDDK